MSARRKHRNGGFTLIELMISMALSMVGLLGLLALQMISVRGNMMSRNFGEAIGVAQLQLELAATTPYATLSTLADPACVVTGSGATRVVSGGTPNLSPTEDTLSAQAIYRRCTVVTVNADNTTVVSVPVYWTDTSSAVHSVTLLTRRSP